MPSYQVEQWLRQGIAAAKAGDMQRAYETLLRVVDVDEYNEQAWLWLSSVVQSDADREVCLENVLAINPENKLAKTGLVHLHARTIPPVPLEPEVKVTPKPPAAEGAPRDWWDQAQSAEAEARPAMSLEPLPARSAPAVQQVGVAAQEARPAPRKRRRVARTSLPALATGALLVLGLLAAAVALIAILRVGPFDPTRRNYARAMRPVLADYEAWWAGSQGALFAELSQVCGPGSEGWRNRDVLFTCNAHPTADCALLAAHCGTDIEAMRKQVATLAVEAAGTGQELLAAFGAISPPDDVALAHGRFVACLRARVADAERINRLARGASLVNPDQPSACQLFSSAEAEVEIYVQNQ
jgi:hypothetical protein